MDEEPKKRMYVRAAPNNTWATLQQLVDGKWVDIGRYPIPEGQALSDYWKLEGAMPLEVVYGTGEIEVTIGDNQPIPPLRPDDKVGNEIKRIIEKAWGNPWEKKNNEQQ